MAEHETGTDDTSPRGTTTALATTAPDTAAKLLVKPLRLHLSIVIVLLLVGISVPIVWFSHDQGKKAALAAAEEQMSLLSQHAIDRYRSAFGDGFATVTLASVVDALGSRSTADLAAKTAFLIKAIDGSPYIDGLYVGYPDGSFLHAVGVERNPRWAEALDTPPDTAFAVRTIEYGSTGGVSTWRFIDRQGKLITQRSTTEVNYDPRRRPWYRAATRENGPVAVGPYVTATTKSLALTLALPMATDKEAVVGVDVLLETISGLLSDQAVSPNARGYVFDGQKKLIVHSDKTMMDQILDSFSTTPKASLQPVTDPALESVAGLLRVGGNDETVRFSVGQEPFIARVATVGFSDLLKGNTVIIAAPLSDFTGASGRLLTQNLAIAGIVLVAGILMALLVARLISRALLSFSEDARQIGNLEFSGQPRQPSWIAEINTLSVALAAAREAIKTFALYVPRELVRKVMTSGQASAGQAMRQEVSILFTDIRDFTTISEQHSPEEVVGLLSDYFQLMNGIVEQHNGVIIQYLGDSIFAMWNAPAPDANHIDDACRCALEIKAGVDGLNAQSRAAGRPELVTRFGVHTGIAVVGSVGAEQRRQYTAMGDTVNVASRLEGMNKQYGTTIMVSGAVRERASPSFDFRPLGAAHAKGRVAEIEVFELAGLLPG